MIQGLLQIMDTFIKFWSVIETSFIATSSLIIFIISLFIVL